jgi:hypothetical protein
VNGPSTHSGAACLALRRECACAAPQGMLGDLYVLRTHRARPPPPGYRRSRTPLQLGLAGEETVIRLITDYVIAHHLDAPIFQTTLRSRWCSRWWNVTKHGRPQSPGT